MTEHLLVEPFHNLRRGSIPCRATSDSNQQHFAARAAKSNPDRDVDRLFSTSPEIPYIPNRSFYTPQSFAAQPLSTKLVPKDTYVSQLQEPTEIGQCADPPGARIGCCFCSPFHRRVGPVA